jgi:hypothetical protein
MITALPAWELLIRALVVCCIKKLPEFSRPKCKRKVPWTTQEPEFPFQDAVGTAHEAR